MKLDFPSRQNVLRKHSDLIARRESERLDAMSAAVDGAVVEGQAPRLLAAVVGVNHTPRDMSLSEIEALGDPFTRDLLLKGQYPLTLSSLVFAIEAIDGGAAFPIRKMFLVAEGGQFKSTSPQFELNARLVFTWQKENSKAPDLLLSTVPVADNEDSLLQLIGWSDLDGAFHFFERKFGVWGWAGNSFHSLRSPSRGKGPFDSHINGGLVMKELKFPWAHWHSQSSVIPREAFPPGSEFRTDPLFSSVMGAEALEGIVKSGVTRWTQSRISRDRSDGGLKNIHMYLRQIVTPTSENLISSSLEFKRVRSNVLRLPTSFFFDVDGFEHGVGLELSSDVIPGGRIEVNGSLYADAVNNLDMSVPDGSGISVEGDTHFCFLVPERAFEDSEVARWLLQEGIVTSQLLLSLLMVDFVNPVRSERRAALLQYCPDEVVEGKSFESMFVQAIEAVSPAGETPEGEFLSYWREPDLHARMRGELFRFFKGIQETVTTLEGVTLLVKLAEWRKALFRQRDLHEFPSTTSLLGRSLAGLVRINNLGIITQEHST